MISQLAESRPNSAKSIIHLSVARVFRERLEDQDVAGALKVSQGEIYQLEMWRLTGNSLQPEPMRRKPPSSPAYRSISPQPAHKSHPWSPGLIVNLIQRFEAYLCT